MKKTRLGMILLTLLIFGVSCGGGSTPSPGSGSLHRIDISNATNLILAAPSAVAGSLSASSATEKKLYKVTEDGLVIEVKYYDEAGNEINSSTQKPVAVYNVNSDYLIVCFGFDTYNINEIYLARKTDGSVFSLKNVGYPIPLSNSYKNANPIKTDYNGNLYFIRLNSSSEAELIKINIEDLNHPTFQIYSSVTDEVNNYDLSKAGNAIYNGHLKGDVTNYIYRIKKANGGLHNLPISTFNYWIGLDQQIYHYQPQKIRKVTINSTDYSHEETDYGGEISMNGGPYTQYKLELSNKIFIIETTNGKIYEVYNEAGTPREVNLAGLSFSSIRTAGSSNNYYYIAGTVFGNSELYKINPVNDSYIKILDGHDVYKITVSANDEVIFNALKMSNGNIVIGKIDSSGSVTILDETINSQVEVLERVN